MIIAFARSLINEPFIIMCDKPTGNLDSHNSEIVLELFRQLAQERRQTLLIVTHDEDFTSRSDPVIELVKDALKGSNGTVEYAKEFISG